jgi:PiT family inorganic phosphate transporter
LLATLFGGIVWNIITWFLGLPTSSSHALIGGLVGSGIVASGIGVVHWPGVSVIFLFIFVAPLLGGIGALVVTTLTLWVFRKWHPAKAAPVLKGLQLFSALLAGIGHGTNDAQKSMGIITMALCAGGLASSAAFVVPHWVVLSCYGVIALGTVAGGWRIVKTMGTNITKIRPLEGFCSGMSASVVLMGTAHFGIPVSTTHVIAGSIMGVGTVEHAATVRWVTARKILWAWILTIPCAATIAALTYLVIHLFV